VRIWRKWTSIQLSIVPVQYGRGPGAENNVQDQCVPPGAAKESPRTSPNQNEGPSAAEARKPVYFLRLLRSFWLWIFPSCGFLDPSC